MVAFSLLQSSLSTLINMSLASGCLFYLKPTEETLVILYMSDYLKYLDTLVFNV